jgi:N-acetylmuramic acid 6-phosphate etherase
MDSRELIGGFLKYYKTVNQQIELNLDKLATLLDAIYARGGECVSIEVSFNGNDREVVGRLRESVMRGYYTACITSNSSAVEIDMVDVPIVLKLDSEQFSIATSRIKRILEDALSSQIHEPAPKKVDDKLIFNRCINAIMEQTGIKERREAESLLVKYGSVKRAVGSYKKRG